MVNYLTLDNHNSMIFTASTDKSCGVFDVQTGERIKRFKGHTSFVNSCSPARRGPELLASGSDDGSVKVRWLLRYYLKLVLICLTWRDREG
jgi:Prp8 binding protein